MCSKSLWQALVESRLPPALLATSVPEVGMRELIPRAVWVEPQGWPAHRHFGQHRLWSLKMRVGR